MKITILGCGSAAGVPVIGNNWGQCDPNNPKNNRLRVSLLVEEEGREGAQTLLFDTSPDMREQLLRADIKDISAILYTHSHADHTLGIDNIRSLNWLTGHSIPIYADADTLNDLRARFAYIFDQPAPTNRFVRPAVEPHVLHDGEALRFGDLNVTPFFQKHGSSKSLGFRINDFGYSTDVDELDEHAFDVLRGIKVWVVDAIRERPHHTHATVTQTLEWIERLKPARAYLTHMDNSLDYETLRAKLPPGVEPAYDGLTIGL